MVAVNELLTNAVRHGGGTGRVTLWRADGAVVCEVSDHGRGLADRCRRARTGRRGRAGRLGPVAGRELTDSIAIKTGPGRHSGPHFQSARAVKAESSFNFVRPRLDALT